MADRDNSEWRRLSHAIRWVFDSRRGVIPSGSELEKHQARLRTRLVAGEFLQRWTDMEGLRHEGKLGGRLWRDGALNWPYSHLRAGKEVFRDVAVLLPHNWDIIKEPSVAETSVVSEPPAADQAIVGPPLNKIRAEAAADSKQAKQAAFEAQALLVSNDGLSQYAYIKKIRGQLEKLGVTVSQSTGKRGLRNMKGQG
jgi:hypothetical protein